MNRRRNLKSLQARLKEQVIAIAFRLFLGTLVIARLGSYLVAANADADPPPDTHEIALSIDSTSALLRSAEGFRRAYRTTSDTSFLDSVQRLIEITDARVESFQQLSDGRPQAAEALEQLKLAVHTYLTTLAKREPTVAGAPRRRVASNAPPPASEAAASKEIDTLLETIKQAAAGPRTAAGPLEVVDSVMSRHLGSLSLMMVDLTVLIVANIVFHRFMKRRRRTEETLRRNEQFARSTVDALPTHIAILDENGIILAANRAWRDFAEKKAGFPEPTTEGMSYLMACDAAGGNYVHEAAELAAGIRAVLSGKQDECVIEYAAHTATDRRWYLARVSRFPGGDDIARLVVSHDNISARKLAEEEVNKAREQAEFANLTKSAFLANTSHELRTPMTAILGYAEMLLDPQQKFEDRRKCVNTIHRNGEHLLAIINDLLDISKIEAQKVNVEKLACPLPQFISEVIGLTRPWAQKKGLDYEIEFDEEIPAVMETDALRAKQVLVNLLGNAMKFTNAGRVRLRVWREISYFRQSIHFEVSDSGIGMTPEQMEKLFQPFTQADVSTTRRFGGTGLGLTISKRLSQLLGGDISVASVPDQGSVFTFHLDGGLREGIEMIYGLSVDQLALDLPAENDDDIFLAGSVLLAEDGEDNQHLISSHLRRAGIDVVIVGNGRQAVEAAKSRRFDLIFMDMQMPELDGYGATRQLRQMGKQTPIVALTANAMAEDRIRCIRAGCTDYLAKPLTRAQLLRMAARFLEPGAPPVDIMADTDPSEKVSPRGPGLRSDIADEPKLQKLLARFIDRLPGRVNHLRELVEENDLASLRQVIHQLKGAGGGYGFPQITDAASHVEEQIKASTPDLCTIRANVDSLIELVRSVDGYDQAREKGATDEGDEKQENERP